VKRGRQEQKERMEEKDRKIVGETKKSREREG
jgi:hypothetical protein